MHLGILLKSHTTDEDFMENNTGKGKIFPCGPTCIFNGKEIPCYCDWSENRSITSPILANILRTLDEYGVCDRGDGVTSFLLLDGCRSRFGLPFLDYICAPKHEWVVCIGVPYGTAMWQIGDASEQNGMMNIASVRKKDIVKQNEAHGIAPYSTPTTSFALSILDGTLLLPTHAPISWQYLLVVGIHTTAI